MTLNLPSGGGDSEPRVAVNAHTHLLLRPVVHDFHLAVTDGAGRTGRELVTTRGGWGCHYEASVKTTRFVYNPQKEAKLYCLNVLAELDCWCGREDSNLHPVARTSS